MAAIHLDKYILYSVTKNREDALKSIFESKAIAEYNRDSTILSMVYPWIDTSYGDSKLINLQNSLLCVKASGFKIFYSSLLGDFGRFYLRKGDFILAKKYILEAIEESKLQETYRAGLGRGYHLLSDYFNALGKTDSALFYARQALQIYQSVSVSDSKLSVYQSLAALYKLNKQPDSAFQYMQLAFNLNDSLNNSGKVRQFQNIGFNELLRVEQLEKDKIELQNAIRMYAMLGGLAVFSIIAVFLYRNNLSRKKANELLQKQKEEVEVQKKNVEKTLVELKSTQAQLIQSEKMASLGELTAGIAHEIQNPLNFVNNFSEVNKELLAEMNEAIEKENYNEVKEIAKDVTDNEEKINHHGKRAEAIVKGMLQHSQASTGKKEPTDINKLADEYLRLAYHGLRAKDKSFNATLNTAYDETIGNINIIPQDIGRVLLNLFNNAFYAASLPSKGGFSDSDYKHQPTITVSTSKNPPSGGRGSEVLISVSDNGPGIPQKIVDKIFQPFFTTKPTGQGTGLGLSLSYDIIKAHGGEIKVETKDGEGTTLIIQIPTT